MSSFKSTLMVCICLVSILTAKPMHRIRELDSVPAKGFKPLHESRSQLTTSGCNEKLCNLSGRSCELHHRTQDSYIWRARPLELIFPIHHAAPVLREIYYAILTQANKQWSLQAPVPSFWIKQGNLELFFRSVGGPIPWSVVARFAHKMLDASQLGFLGTYDTVYQNSAANQAVGVTMRIADNQPSLLPHHVTKSSTVRAAKRTDLKKRTGPHLTSYKIYGGIVPNSIAAPFVKAFFDAIAVQASNAWTSRPESALLTLTQGPFQLTVSCLGASIPWPTLVSAARKFSALADRSWANTFDAFYEEPESAITIAISLRLLQKAAGLGLMTISQPIRRNLPSHSPSATPLRARTAIRPTPPKLRLTTFIQTAAIVPSALTAAKLEDFYTIIALKIETGQFANRIPSKTVTFSLWDFELNFSCDKINVPLSFVQAFVIDMAEWSSKQFTGLYEATVRGDGPLTGLVFYVQMRLKGKVQQSPHLK